MKNFDADAHLLSLKPTHPRLLFYPSCGDNLLWTIMRLEYDIFVFSDYAPSDENLRQLFWLTVQEDARMHGVVFTLYKATVRTRVFRSNGKWGFLFFQDNNEALSRIANADYLISAFVGIRDGCAEGGNYECVNEFPFLEKVLSLANSPFSYYTNHSSLLTDSAESLLRNHTFFLKRQKLEAATEAWEFKLDSVLVIYRERSIFDFYLAPKSEDFAVFFPGYGFYSYYSEYRAHPNKQVVLWKFLPFRIKHGEGVIARYSVARGRAN